MGHRHEKTTFEGSDGLLSGTLQIPDGRPRAGVVLAHCFTCSKSLKITRALATGIEAAGFAVLRFDFTGLGESEGDFAQTTVTSNVQDLEAAAQVLDRRGYGAHVLVGHSLGGAAALLATARMESIRAVVAVAAPSTPDHVTHLFAQRDIDTAFRDGRATVSIAGRKFEISASFFRDIERHCTPETIEKLGRPLQVVHGTADRIVGIEHSERIFDAAHHPKWFSAIPEADHLFSKPEHAQRASGAIVAFLAAVL